jgi:ELWxxDGT repeat protein
MIRTFFAANDGPHGIEPWITDGTAAGTVLLKDIDPLAGSSSPTGYVQLGNKVLFAATDANGTELWITDGTTAGTMMLKDVRPGGPTSNVNNLTVLGDKVLFSANDGTTGFELWVTDGTTAGTVLLKDINTTANTGSNLSALTVLGDKILFQADNGLNGVELWVSDGTAAGTVLLKDINTSAGGNSSPSALTTFGDKVLFRANDGITGAELWISDGTAAGTVLLKDINPIAGAGSGATNFTLFGNKMLFEANNGSNGIELWITDGTTAGTVLLKDINPTGNSLSGTSGTYTVLGNKVLFAADNGSGQELWVTDGTTAGTVLLKDINPSGGSNPTALTTLGSNVLFQANDGNAAHGAELWVSDGTAAGTVMLKDLESGSGSSSPRRLTLMGNQVLFAADSVANGAELWVTDGTAAGTVLLKDINPTGSSVPLNLKTVLFNEAPAIDLNAGGGGVDNSANYSENAGPVLLSTILTVSDADDTNIAGATLQVGGGFIAGQDLLTINGGTSGTSGTISWSYNGGTGLLTLTGSATLAAYQALLRQAGFESTSNAPGASRTVTWKVNDGTVDSAAATTTVTVTAVNDGPVNTVPGAQGGTEDTDLVFSTGAGNRISVADPDAGGGLTVTLSVLHGKLTLASTAGLTVTGNGTGNVQVTGTAAAINTALDGLVYRGNLNYNGGDTLTVNSSDGGNSGTGGTLTDNDNVSITLAPDGIITGDSGPNVFIGTPGPDSFRLEQGGNDQASGLGGNDFFFFGAALTSADQADGGPGNDQLGIQGNYNMTLGSGIVGMESLSILPGSDTRFGDPGTNFYDYVLTSVEENVAAGQRLTIDATRLRVGEDFTFNGTAESDGNFFIGGGGGVDNLTGGQQSDTFLFGELGQWGASDIVNGGPGGANDQLSLRGDYTIVFGAGQLLNIDSISMVSAFDTRFGPLGSSFDYNLTMNQANVAANQVMAIDAAPLRSNETLTFNGSAETDGTFRIAGGAGNDTIVAGGGADLLIGRGGADSLTGGGGNDTFRYDLVSDSTPGIGRDGIQDFTLGDRIDLSRIDAIAGGANDAFTSIGSAAFSNVAGQLRFAETSVGSNIWLVQGDIDGDNVADIEFFVTTPTSHQMVAGDFVL